MAHLRYMKKAFRPHGHSSGAFLLGECLRPLNDSFRTRRLEQLVVIRHELDRRN